MVGLRGEMTFTINKRSFIAFGAVLAVTVAAIAVGYLAGQPPASPRTPWRCS